MKKVTKNGYIQRLDVTISSPAKVLRGVDSIWRRHPESDRGIKVLQTFALPLGYGADFRRTAEAVKRLPRFPSKNGAVDEARTRDLHLGKVALYQLSYYRRRMVPWGGIEPPTHRFSVYCSTD